MILITGATGFLGQHVTQALLEAGHELRLLVRHAAQRQLPMRGLVDMVDGDVNDWVSLERAMEGVTEVVHLAALVSFWRKRNKDLHRVNVRGTENVVNACLQAGVERLVHMSSTGATGKEAEDQPVTEATKWLPGKHNNAYGLSKHKAELEVYRGMAEGLPAVILNPGVIIGPGDWQAGPPKIFSIVDKGLNYYNRGRIGLVGAQDVARATLLALERSDMEGERFILVAENPLQQEFFAEVARALGKEPPSRGLPAAVSLMVGSLSEGLAALTGKEPVITRASMRSSIRRFTYDGSKITQYGFAYTPIKQVIQQTAQAYLARDDA